MTIQDFKIIQSGKKLQVRKITPDPTPNTTDETSSQIPLVFLHEGLGCVNMWKDFPELFANNVSAPTYIYDRWGHGKSDGLDGGRKFDYLRYEAIESLPEVLNILGIKEAVLVGHSDGASIALIFAATFPQRVRSIISEAAHVFVEDITIEGIRKTDQLYCNGDLRSKLAKYHHSNTESLFAGWRDTWLAPRFRQWNIEEYLPKIKCPVQIIQGIDDEYATEKHVEAIASQLTGPHKKLFVPNCGHTPHLQQKQIVLQAMTEFYRAHSLSLA